MNDVARLIQTESSGIGVTQQIHDVNGGTKRKVYYNIHQAHLTYAIRGHKNIKTVMTNYLLSSITQIGVLTYLTGNVVWLVA